MGLLAVPAGYLLSRLYPPLADEPLWVQIAASLLLGLALWPLVVAAASLAGFSLGATAVRAYVALSLVLAVVVAARCRPPALPRPSAYGLALLGVLLATLVLRVWQARQVVWPLWGDAVNHSAATALFLEQGGLPSTWGEYVPTSTTFSYHFGFHSWAAAICWLTPVPPWWAVFWTERFLNVITPLSLYLLAYTLFRDRRVALGAAVASGLLTLMPQYYVNWSRDPQLGGQVLLPLLAYLALTVVQRPRGRVRGAVLLAIGVAGLAFVHYRVLVFAFGLFLGLAAMLTRGDLTVRRLAWPVAGMTAGLAVATPWVLRVLAVQRQAAALTPVSYAEGYVTAYFSAPALADYVHPWMLCLAVVGLALGLRRWRRPVLCLAIWLLVLALSGSGYRTGISALSLVTYISIFMLLYLPLSLGFGILFDALVGWAATRSREDLGLAVAVPVAVAAGFALHGDILDDIYVLVRPEDVRTFEWIEENTPSEALFLVNSFSASGEGGVIVGSDAGWWLPQAADRATTLPVINYTTELVDPAYVAELQQLSSASVSPTSPESIAAFCQAGVTHVYVGALGGVLPLQSLLQDGQFQLLHQDGDAYVFALDCVP